MSRVWRIRTFVRLVVGLVIGSVALVTAIALWQSRLGWRWILLLGAVTATVLVGRAGSRSPGGEGPQWKGTFLSPSPTSHGSTLRAQNMRHRTNEKLERLSQIMAAIGRSPYGRSS
jgi:hypothetical protein